MDIIEEALAFERDAVTLKSRDERIRASHKLKELILGLNEVYKLEKDPSIMEIMKRLTLTKQKIEVRLKGRLSS
ncbi:hypothetical protein MWU59_07110 [Flavobacteriaceae bacterium F08102]|nr:hypothetical protein [Flavobacteriaceae bacterium F08102]